MHTVRTTTTTPLSPSSPLPPPHTHTITTHPQLANSHPSQRRRRDRAACAATRGSACVHPMHQDHRDDFPVAWSIALCRFKFFLVQRCHGMVRPTTQTGMDDRRSVSPRGTVSSASRPATRLATRSLDASDVTANVQTHSSPNRNLSHIHLQRRVEQPVYRLTDVLAYEQTSFDTHNKKTSFSEHMEGEKAALRKQMSHENQIPRSTPRCDAENGRLRASQSTHLRSDRDEEDRDHNQTSRGSHPSCTHVLRENVSQSGWSSRPQRLRRVPKWFASWPSNVPRRVVR